LQRLIQYLDRCGQPGVTQRFAVILKLLVVPLIGVDVVKRAVFAGYVTHLHINRSIHRRLERRGRRRLRLHHLDRLQCGDLAAQLEQAGQISRCHGLVHGRRIVVVFAGRVNRALQLLRPVVHFFAQPCVRTFVGGKTLQLSQPVRGLLRVKYLGAQSSQDATDVSVDLGRIAPFKRDPAFVNLLEELLGALGQRIIENVCLHLAAVLADAHVAALVADPAGEEQDSRIVVEAIGRAQQLDQGRADPRAAAARCKRLVEIVPGASQAG